jgi:hypothetical protein
LPADLLRRKRARDEAASEVAAARAAHRSLVGEFAEAQATVRRAESEVIELAGEVFVAETAEQGTTLAAAWTTLWATVDCLNGLSSSGVRLPLGVIRSLQSLRRWITGNFREVATVNSLKSCRIGIAIGKRFAKVPMLPPHKLSTAMILPPIVLHKGFVQYVPCLVSFRRARQVRECPDINNS